MGSSTEIDIHILIHNTGSYDEDYSPLQRLWASQTAFNVCKHYKNYFSYITVKTELFSNKMARFIPLAHLKRSCPW